MIHIYKAFFLFYVTVLVLCLTGCKSIKEVNLAELQQLVSGPKGQGSTMELL
jgi:hypothetical protein